MEEKKQIEKLLMEGFRKYFPEFPKGNLVISESPDFVLRLKSNNYLGIELTRLHPEHSNNYSDREKNQIKTENEIVERTKEIFNFSDNRPLFVKFSFSGDQKISEERIISVSAQTVQAIRRTMNQIDGDFFFSRIIPGEELPQGIHSILIMKHPELQVPVWEKANNLGISDDIIADIRFSIHKKDDKLRLYRKRKLNHYWLLVTADRLQGISSFNIENKIMNHSFISGFQHVFLYELMKERVFRLV